MARGVALIYTSAPSSRRDPCVTDDTKRYKKAPSRKKAAPVRHIGLSADAKKAYEDIVRERDEREKTYGRHLAASGNGKQQK